MLFALTNLIETEPLVRDLRSCEQNHLGMADMGGEKELDQFGGVERCSKFNRIELILTTCITL